MTAAGIVQKRGCLMKTKYLWGWLTALIACATLWAVGLRPLGGHPPADVPLEARSEWIEKNGRPAIRLSVKNQSRETLHAVEILGMGESNSTRMFRREEWMPGETVELGGRDGWELGKNVTVEISAKGYACRKIGF